MPRLLPVALALAVLASLVFAQAAQAKQARRVLFLRQGSGGEEAALLEALRIQLAGSAELVELRAAPSSAEAQTAWQSTHAELLVWLGDAQTGDLIALRASRPAERLDLGPAPDGAEASRVLALKLSELLEAEPDVALPPEPRRVPQTIAFVELRAGATYGGSPVFWLPSLGFAAGPRFRSAHDFVEAYGSFALAADVRALSRVGEVETSLAYFGAGARALRRFDAFALGPYLELGLMVLRARGAVDATHGGSAELRAPLAQVGLEGRVVVSDAFELRGALGGELWLERQRLELRATPVLDFGRLRPAFSLSVLLPLF